MPSSDLDYIIDFPDKLSGSQEDSPSQDEKEEGTRLPLVIILGWSNASFKNLSKYSDIYHKRGCIVIRYTSPWPRIFFDFLGIPSLRVFAQKLLELLFDHKVEKEPLLFHIFSNNGAVLYRYVLELLQTHQRFRQLHVVGTIFDSCPGDKNLVGTLRALTYIMWQHSVVQRALSFVLFILLSILYQYLFPSLIALFRPYFYDALLDTRSRWPELYLYSKADVMVRAKDVERMIRARQAHGVPVRSVDFESSAHIFHLRDFPIQYTNTCVDFMHSCVLAPPISPKL